MTPLETPDDADPHAEGQPGIARAALFGLCPRCGARGLFAGVASFATQCGTCGLNFASFNVGDGPAAFLTMVVGAVIMALALWLHFALLAPMWVIALLLVPMTAALVIGGLRLAKAALLGLEFHRRASEFQSRP